MPVSLLLPLPLVVIFGRFPIYKRLAIAVGGGFQIATTHFHTNNHNGIFTVRFPF